jgi:hypothetical protein
MVRGSTIVLITPSSSRDVALVVDYLLQRGLKPIVVILDTSTFGGTEGADQLVGSIKLLGVPFRLIKNEMELSAVLSDGYSSK